MKSICLVLLTAAVFADGPLARYDFTTGTGAGLTIVGTPPPTATIDGARHAVIGPGRRATPISWSEDLPNPTFPGGVGGDSGGAAPPADRLVLDLAIEGAHDLAVIVHVYDICEVNSGSGNGTLTWQPVDPKARHRSARFTVSGDPYSSEPLYRPRPLAKTMPVYQAQLANGLDGGDLVLEAACPIYIRRIEVWPLLPSPLTDLESRRVDGMTAYGDRRVPASIFDVWERDLADLLGREAAAFAAWSDSGKGDPQPVLLAIDRFWYEGRAALARDDHNGYTAPRDAARRAVDTLLKDAGTPPPTARPLVGSDRFDPAQRVRFTTFANSSWELWDPHNATADIFNACGIDTMGYLAGTPTVNEDGTLEAHGLASWDSARARVLARGWDLNILVGHHQAHLTRNLPRWLRQQVGDEPLYDITADGKEMANKFDIWNPATRDYYVQSVEALAAHTAPNPHISPWFYWGEPMSSSGRTPAALRAFRDYLHSKYGTITALNEAWGSTYADFAAIELPVPAREAPRTTPSPLAYEHECFRRDGFTDWCRQTAAALRRGDPNARLWFEGWGRLDYLLVHGMDQLAIYDVADIAACHTGSAGQLLQRHWQDALSAYSGTMQSDGEINIYGPYYNGCFTLDQLHAAANSHLRQQTWHGVRLFMYWMGQLTLRRCYSYGGPTLYDGNQLSPLTPSGLAIREARQFADEVDPILRRTALVPSPVGILYSPSSFLQGWPYNEVEHVVYPLHGMLHNSDYGYRFVHETAIVDGREDLTELRVLFVPWGVYLQPAAATKLRAWVQLGGTLIAGGPVGAFDQLGRPQSVLLEDVFGPGYTVSYVADERPGDPALDADSPALLAGLGDNFTTHFGSWAWRIDAPNPPPDLRVVLRLADGTPVVYERPSVSGKYIVGTGPLGKNGLRAWLMREVAAKADPLVRWHNHDGLQVTPRADAAGNLYLGVFSTDVDDEVVDEIRVRGYDQTFAVRLQPGESQVISLPGTGSGLPPRPPHRDESMEFGVGMRSAPMVVGGTRDLPAGEVGQRQALMLAARRALASGYGHRAYEVLAPRAGDRKADFAPTPPVCPEDVAVAHRAARPITIDGDPAEWRDVPRYAVKSSGDNGGDFACQWDDEYLYVLAVARDTDTVVPEETGSDANWIWLYDGIALVLNTCDQAPVIPCGALYDATYRATQTATLVATTGRRYANSAAGYSSASVRSATTAIDGGWIMEVAIPHRQVMLPAFPGVDVAFEFKIVNRGRNLGFARYGDRESWSADCVHFARLRLAE